MRIEQSKVNPDMWYVKTDETILKIFYSKQQAVDYIKSKSRKKV